MIRGLFAVALALGVAFASLVPQAGADEKSKKKWELLGQQSVGLAADRDVVQVSKPDDTFKRIRFGVKEHDIEILDAKVVYSDGATDDIDIDQTIKAGKRTKGIKLKTGKKPIKSVELIYKSDPAVTGNAVVQVWAR